MRRKNLDGDDSLQARIAGAIDLSHPARAERALNLIRPELCAGRESHKRGAIIALNECLYCLETTLKSQALLSSPWPLILDQHHIRVRMTAHQRELLAVERPVEVVDALGLEVCQGVAL